MSNSFGNLFRFTTFGESHGTAMGVVVDGCPAGLKLDMDAIQVDLDRRKPGQNRISSQRKESDRVELLSGTINGMTTGAPLAFLVRNEDQRSADYDHIEQVFRPSHADFTYFAKYGIRDHRGGGRSSARETLCRVIAGGVAKQLLFQATGMRFEAWVKSVGEISWDGWPTEGFGLETEFAEATRCPDLAKAGEMYAAIDAARLAGDSLGGIITGRILHSPIGLGEPIYDKVEALLGAAMLSINAVKGFEIGSGFAGTRMKGSAHNDLFQQQEGQIRTVTNHSGGLQGGITNGAEIYFNIAFKPTATLMRDQETVDAQGNPAVAKGKGRHDPCVVPRAVPIVEAMAACVMADLWLLSKTNRMD